MFIVFDGIDRSGKSTHLALVCEWLKNKNIDFFSAREPGGTQFAEKIRTLIQQEEPCVIDPIAQLLLFFLARHDLTKKLVDIKKTEPDKLILCDRFIDSTYAYQGQFFSSVQIDSLKNLISSIDPDFIFLFLDTYGQNKDHMDMFATKHKNEIIERFKQRAALNEKKYFIVPAGDLKFQQEIICNKLEEILIK